MTTTNLLTELENGNYDVLSEIEEKLMALDKIMSEYKGNPRLNMLYDTGLLSVFETNIMDIIYGLNEKYK